MSANSSASKPPPLCYCGVRARVRHSWTSSNPTRKWYGCVKYKEDGDCDFFQWADNEMTTYEKNFVEYLKRMEDGRQADIGRLQNRISVDMVRLENLMLSRNQELYAKIRSELGLCDSNRKMFWAAFFVIVFVLVLYISGFSGSRVSYLMLK